MIGTTEYGLLQLRQGTASALAAENPVLAAGEPAVSITGSAVALRIGDGQRRWLELPVIASTAFDVTAILDDLNEAAGRLDDLTVATPSIWSATTDYVIGDVTRRNGQTWLAVSDPAVGAEPGVSSAWASLALEALHTRAGSGGPGGGVTAHSALTGLDGDDHPQYALADGTRGLFAPRLGADDNYVTDAEKSKIANLGTAASTPASDYATAAQGAKADSALQPGAAQAINAQTGTTYTLVAADAGKVVTLTNAAPITLNAPGGVFTAGQRVDIVVAGAGMATVVGTAGATANGTPSLISRAQWSALTVLYLTPTSAVVIGDLA